MPWVSPHSTRGAGSLMVWEEQQRNSLFVLQRHRLATEALGSQVGSLFASARRLASSVRTRTLQSLSESVPSHRIVLADYDATVVAMDEDADDVKREWQFLEERVVPQLQVK